MSDLVRRDDVLQILADFVKGYPSTDECRMCHVCSERIRALPEAKIHFGEVYDDIGAIKDKLDELREWI